ncbi:MAG TPA: nitrous oxide reductase accessory protein NosL [Acidimicrobiia bacterium]|nr:nitrous oxide reductase accessory protein NosL [Acidimicrobiia bacterium]
MRSARRSGVWYRSVQFLVGVTVLTAGCASAESTGPPAINYGRDICVECGMIIQDARFATAYRLPDGAEKLFDDVGDMIVHLRQSGDSVDQTTMWVHDYETEEWVSVDAAFFVPTVSVATPMGHSIIAFSDEGRASTFAGDVDGEVITWDVVMTLPSIGGLIGDHHSNGSTESPPSSEGHDGDH